MRTKDTIIDLSKRMIRTDRPRDSAFDAYRDMFHMVWSLPPELDVLDWIHKSVTADPHNAIIAAVRVLVGKGPVIKKTPYGHDEQNKQKANADERNLGWQLKSANKLRSLALENDLMQSALLYASCAAMVIDLDWQIEQAKKMKKDTAAMERGRNYTRFIVPTYLPRDVHVRRAVYGTDTVLLCQKRMPYEVKEEWWDVDGKLSGWDEAEHPVYYYDMMDYDMRAIWVSAEPEGEPIWIMPPLEHKLNFNPWIAVMGASSLESDPQHQYHPMLYPLHHGGIYDTVNMIDTIASSEMITLAAIPRIVEEGPNPEYAEIDSDPTRTIKPPPGNIVKQLNPPIMNEGLMEVSDRKRFEIQRATLSNVLQGGEMAAGTAFSTLNLMTQTAIGQLKPYKLLTEKAIAEVCEKMLLWTEHTGNAMYAYGTSDMDLGEEYVIEPDEIDTGSIYLSVEMTPDIPTDELRRANTGSILAQLGYPASYVFEEMGVEDPQAAMKQSYFERDTQHLWEMKWEKERQQLQMQTQQQMMAMQAQIQQQQMAQQQQAQMQQQAMQQQMPPEGPQGGPPAPPGMPQGGSPISGQGFNPAMGGQPPVEGMVPERTARISEAEGRGV